MYQSHWSMCTRCQSRIQIKKLSWSVSIY